MVQIIAWRRPGGKPLSELMMARLPTHICVTRPQWVKTQPLPSGSYWTVGINKCLHFTIMSPRKTLITENLDGLVPNYSITIVNAQVNLQCYKIMIEAHSYVVLSPGAFIEDSMVCKQTCHKNLIVTFRGCREIWEALVLRTSDMASALVRNQMCTCPRLIKLICAIIICSSIGRVSSDSHLSDKAKIVFRTIGRPFRLPLLTWLTYYKFTTLYWSTQK